MSDKAVRRIQRELLAIQQTNDLSIRVDYKDNDILGPKAIILGPPGTPYEFGFFEFSIKFPKDYPDQAPTVNALTTHSGTTRFNPNIYANGKVCLSILGTWRGERGEEWSSAQGLESVMLSIQSLMSSCPYENEPGFEKKKSKEDQKNMVDYVDKIKHETLRISVIRRLENYLGIYSDGTVANKESESTEEGDDMARAHSWEPFKDFCKRRFLWYFESYLEAINKETTKHRAGTKFKTMPFEHPGNTMDGEYQYVDLRRRLLLIRKVLDQESARWVEEGALCVKQERPQAAQMFLLFNQTREMYNRSDALPTDISLEDEKNPFIWIISYIGQAMTDYDGGMFRIRIVISTNFPEEWPRVSFETPIFHHRITKDGVLCYTPLKYGDLSSHIEAIISALEEENPPYDPRVLVNLEASRLFWGKPEERKAYRSRLRRSVLRTMDG